MTDKTLPDSESVRQLTENLRDAYVTWDEVRRAADLLDAQSARIAKLEEALKEIVAYSGGYYPDDGEWDGGYGAGWEDAADVARRALTETK